MIARGNGRLLRAISLEGTARLFIVTEIYALGPLKA